MLAEEREGIAFQHIAEGVADLVFVMIARYFSRAVVLIRLRSGPIGPVLAERTVCVDGSAATL